jgi:hypothetical protein
MTDGFGASPCALIGKTTTDAGDHDVGCRKEFPHGSHPGAAFVNDAYDALAVDVPRDDSAQSGAGYSQELHHHVEDRAGGQGQEGDAKDRLATCWPTRVPRKVGSPPIRPRRPMRRQDGTLPTADRGATIPKPSVALRAP